MLLEELLFESETDDVKIARFLQESAVMAWGRVGNKIVKRYRCSSGPRKGRLTTKPANCAKKIDIKRRLQLRKTLAKMKSRISRKANRTKRINPISKRVALKNKQRAKK